MFPTKLQDTSNHIQLQQGEKPDFEFGLFLDGIIFDRIRNKCEYVTLGENRLEEIENISRQELQNRRFTIQGKKSSLLETGIRVNGFRSQRKNKSW